MTQPIDNRSIMTDSEGKLVALIGEPGFMTTEEENQCKMLVIPTITERPYKPTGLPETLARVSVPKEKGELWDLSPNEYQKQAMRTLCDQSAAQRRIESRELAQYLHAVIGLQGEVGELATMVQKWVWYGKPLTREEVAQNVKEEAGDIFWYLSELLSFFGLTFQEVMEANNRKLRTRYPEKWSEEKAAHENRDLAAEAKAMRTHEVSQGIEPTLKTEYQRTVRTAVPTIDRDPTEITIGEPQLCVLGFDPAQGTDQTVVSRVVQDGHGFGHVEPEPISKSTSGDKTLNEKVSELEKLWSRRDREELKQKTLEEIQRLTLEEIQRVTLGKRPSRESLSIEDAEAKHASEVCVDGKLHGWQLIQTENGTGRRCKTCGVLAAD